MDRKRLIYRILPILGFLVITFVFFRKAIFSNHVYMTLPGDSYFAFYSWSYYFLDCMKNGIFPLWNNLSLCGHPFGTEAPSNFNILNFLVLIFEPKTAWNIRFICCMFFSGYFAYLYARQVKISRYSGFICGVVYLFSTSVLDAHLHTVTLFVPMLLLCLDKAVLLKNILWVILAAVLMMLYYLNSNPQFVFYIFLFLNIYVVFRYSMVYKTEKLILSRGLWRIILIFALLVFGLSSFHVLRTMEITRICQRGIWHSQYFMLSPAHLITFIFPYFYDSPFRPEYNFIFGRIWVELFKHIPHFLGKAHVISAAPYLGILPLTLAILAFIKRSKKSLESFFGWSALVVVIYVLTPFIWHLMIRYIPVVNMMFQIQRIYIIYDISLAVLAGFGMDMFLNKKKSLLRGIVQYISKVYLVILTGLLLIMSFIRIYMVLNKDMLLGAIRAQVEKHIIGNPLFIAPAELYYERANQFYNSICSWADILAPSFLISAIAILLSVILLRLYFRGLIGKRVLKALVLLVILLDLFLIISPRINSSPEGDIAPGGDVITFLKQQPGIFRVIQIQDGDLMKPMDPMAILRPNSNLFYGLASSEGFQSLIIGRYVQVMEIFAKGTDKDLSGLIGEFEGFNHNLASLMNIRYIVTSSQKILNEEFRPVYEDGKYKVYENLKVLPRAFTVNNMMLVKDEEAIKEKLADENFSFKRTVILKESPKFDSSASAIKAGKEYANIKTYEPHKVVINAALKEDGYLLLTDCYFPGWKVLIDGKPAKIYRADYIFRAVVLSKGEHSIEFIYDPISFKIGIAITIITLFAICLVLMRRYLIYKNRGNLSWR